MDNTRTDYALRDALTEITRLWRESGSDADATNAGAWNQSGWDSCLVGFYMRHRGYALDESWGWYLKGERQEDSEGFAMTRAEIAARDFGMDEWSSEFDALTNWRNTVPMLWAWVHAYVSDNVDPFGWQEIRDERIALDSDDEYFDL